MKNYAVIENDIVVNIVIGDEDWAATQDSTMVELKDGDIASIGGKYINGIFGRPKPYPSWIEHEDYWIPPISKPKNIEGKTWMWNEPTVSWVSIEVNASSVIEEPNDEFAD